jgi:hypothetical protein
MQTAEATLCPSQLADEITPAWLEGYRDGLAVRSESAPNMARGRDYAMGWLTARYRHPLSVAGAGRPSPKTVILAIDQSIGW